MAQSFSVKLVNRNRGEIKNRTDLRPKDVRLKIYTVVVLKHNGWEGRLLFFLICSGQMTEIPDENSVI